MSTTLSPAPHQLGNPTWKIALHALATGETERIFELSSATSPAVAKRVSKILHTHANGVPSQYENAWHWAGEWVKVHGVTLPPDTSELRTLRNWFCFQVNMYKKGRLSERSKALLAKYKVDLAEYRAPNTGRGTLIDDQAMVDKMLLHFEITGSYDLPAEADPALIEWQRRILDSYRSRGTTARMRAIEAKLPGLRIGLWMRPDETPVPASQLHWWRRADEFRHATLNCPAFRGCIDKRTTPYLFLWASEQISASRDGKLTQRQKGELKSLGILSTQDHQRSRARAEALQTARAAVGMHTLRGARERDLRSFLGVTLFMRMVGRNAELKEFYATLAITPHQFDRVRQALKLIMVPLASLCSTHRVNALRAVYQEHAELFDNAKSSDDLPEAIFADGGDRNSLLRLANLALECRDIMRSIGVRQDLPRPTAAAAAQADTAHYALAVAH